MKIISWNVNGIRAVERKKEIHKLLNNFSPDILLLQEIKAKAEQLSNFLTKNENFFQYYHSAIKPGYSGTGIWVKKNLLNNFDISTSMPNFDDTEGRIMQLDFEIKNKKFVILNIYFPNGGKSKESWNGKLIFYKNFLHYINQLRKQKKEVIWAGDVNCAHQEIDLARPNENKNSIGFLPEERACIDQVLEHNWIDIFRKKFPEKVIYSWWDMITRARERNVGWRIDYFFCDQEFYSKVKKIDYLNSQFGSDHCPVFLEI